MGFALPLWGSALIFQLQTLLCFMATLASQLQIRCQFPRSPTTENICSDLPGWSPEECAMAESKLE